MIRRWLSAGGRVWGGVGIGQGLGGVTIPLHHMGLSHNSSKPDAAIKIT